MEDCVFCKIAAGEIPARKVFEDNEVLAFEDLSPQAPVHVLLIPKRHARDLLGARELEDATLARLLRAAAEIAALLGVDKTGFRVIANCGPDACQSVPHLHLHLLGGRKLPETMT